MSESDEAARKRRAAALLGELLPSQTRDDLADPDDSSTGKDWAEKDWAGKDGGDTSRDRQIADDVPPHHGS